MKGLEIIEGLGMGGGGRVNFQPIHLRIKNWRDSQSENVLYYIKRRLGQELSMDSLLSFVLGPLIAVIILRAFPDIIAKAITQKVSFENEKKLAKLKEEYRANYETLRMSFEYIISRQGCFQDKAIESLTVLWDIMVKLSESYSDIIMMHSVLTSDEISNLVSGELDHTTFRGIIDSYSSLESIAAKYKGVEPPMVQSVRPFVTDRTWMIFWIERALLGRVSYLLYKSVEEKVYRPWIQDSNIISMINDVLPEDVANVLLAKEFVDLREVIGGIEAEFLKEARRELLGTTNLNESLSDLQAIQKYHHANTVNDLLRSS